MRWEIENVHASGVFKEVSVAVGDYSYLVIFGKHVNGGFCCIPNFNAGCELSSHDRFSDIGYNAEKIGKALKNKTVGRCIAEAISGTASYDEERRD